MRFLELRDNIYKHFDAFLAGKPTKALYKERMNCHVQEKERRAALAKSSYAVLAHVCRQIRHEYLEGKLLTFHRTTFTESRAYAISIRTDTSRFLVHRKHAHVSIYYGDLEHWFDNCQVDAENIWHVRHVHILVSPNDEMIRKAVSMLSLLQYQARHSTTFDCSFQYLDEFHGDLSWFPSTSFWSNGLTSSEMPWRHSRKKMIDINNLIGHRDEGWLKTLREDPSILEDVTLVAQRPLLITLESHSKLDSTVLERLFRAFELDRDNYRHLPESRLTGPLFILKHPQSLQKVLLGQSRHNIG